jgi:toxin ParE1/3/4
LTLSARAQRDYRSILLQSKRTWGEQQMLAYEEQLHRALTNLAMFPEMGTRRDDLKPGIRALTVEAHVVLYRVRNDRIAVARIVHGRMDLTRVFK